MAGSSPEPLRQVVSRMLNSISMLKLFSSSMLTFTKTERHFATGVSETHIVRNVSPCTVRKHYRITPKFFFKKRLSVISEFPGSMPSCRTPEGNMLYERHAMLQEDTGTRTSSVS